MSDDERPVYSDIGYFTRGRAAYRPDTEPAKTDAIVSVLALTVIGIVFGLCVWLR